MVRAICGDSAAMRTWFAEQGFPADELDQLQFTAVKPLARMFIDDKNWRFEGPGTFPTIEQVRDTRSWNQKS